ncbi:MAG: hypothetical protein KA746_02145 [Pyrinomonadaceae bacterium]|nr:hypothetical protein [Pyrinomonadaceae bacterium]MBP6211519.1 hypothetical protein [Pyrinomonadaceae bacterium]
MIAPKGPTMRETPEQRKSRETDEEKVPLKAEQDRIAWKEELSKEVADLNKSKWMPEALKAFGQAREIISEPAIPIEGVDPKYSSAAITMGKLIMKQCASFLTTSEELSNLAEGITMLALSEDHLFKRFPEEYQNIEITNLAVGNPIVGQIWTSFGKSEPFGRRKLNAPRSIELERFASTIRKISDDYYNDHPISENKQFEEDDDREATPRNLFSWKRITDYMSTLPDFPLKYAYLLKIRRKLENRDPSGEIRSGGSKHFSGDIDKGLFRKLREEIAIYDTIGKIAREEFEYSSVKNADIDDSIDEISTRAAHIEPRNQKQVFLALEFLLRTLGTTGDDTAQGKLMSFLSGYSGEEMRKNFSRSGKWNDRIESIRCVRDVFLNAKMNKAVMNKLDGEIENLRKSS